MLQPASAVIVNADDWGQDIETTDRIYDCFVCGAISSVSAMVFMEDSERAAVTAQDHHIDAGLHLNLTTPFSSPKRLSRLREHQQRVFHFLRSRRLAPAFYHPGLNGSFEYVVTAQLEEFERLYGFQPSRIDGHHHMHLCANVVRRTLLPAGTIVRRNFSLGRKEKSYANLLYRRWQDRKLAQRHRLADYFFSIQPLDRPDRLEKFADLARHFTVEVETHPFNIQEHKFLTEGKLQSYLGNVEISRGYVLRPVCDGMTSHKVSHLAES
jgi:chitin disaccharide deacetylase